MTPTQFAARALDVLPYPPPSPKKGSRFGTSPDCWLCGGPTDGIGWPQALAIAPTFTNHNQARAPHSDAVCQSCAAFTRAESWQALVTRRGMDIKIWTQAGWHCFSHLVLADGGYECPVPSRVRAFLMAPPDRPWLLALNPSGKKHTLFRGAVSAGLRWCVQFDETRIYATSDAFLACLTDFETATALGLAKADVLSGQYNPTGIHRAGLGPWRAAELRMRPWRIERPDLLDLVHYCARSATAQGFDYSRPDTTAASTQEALF